MNPETKQRRKVGEKRPKGGFNLKLSTKEKLGTIAIEKAVDYLRKDPQKRLPELLSMVEKLDRKKLYARTYQNLRNAFEDEDNNWTKLIYNIIENIDPQIVKKFLVNVVLYSGMFGYELQKESRLKYQCNIPWAVLMDPTSACNLHCTGCWAAEYGHQNNLSLETMDRIITEGKELGTYIYIFSGGEPLVKKEQILDLCRMHPDCVFLAFTNGTLVDDAFAEQMREVGNFTLAFSIEGFEEETDMRRGKGTYQKVLQAMDILREHHVPFGFSTCYHKYNTEKVGSDAYIDFMIEKGCLFGWYFTYMPVGTDAVPDLLATDEQRAYMYRRMADFREQKPIFALDFWNDGEYVGGCIAGGRSYLHINAAGDVEPCAFIHYANVNINECSLLEALQSPLFMAYYENQPFNENHLRPCPLLDNTGALARMVHASGAHSTDMLSPEDVEELTEKCRNAAEHWAPVADALWREKHGGEGGCAGCPHAQAGN